MRVIRARASLCAGLALAAALLLAPTGTAQPGPEAGAPGPPRTDSRPGEAFADPSLAKLQRTAAGVQRDLADLAGKIHDAERELAAATADATAARTARERADATVAAQQAEVDAYSAAVYSSLAQPTEVRALMSAGPDDFLDGASLLDRLRADQDTRLGGAVRRQAAAEAAERAADAARADAASRRADLDRRTEDARNRAAAVSSELAGIIADTDAAVVDQQREQRRRNDRTAANWRAYLDKLAAAGIEPPPAAALRDPAALPAGLSPLPGQRGMASITLPSGEVLLVLPEETVTAVTRAVDALGKPYVPGRDGTGPAAYSCDGLVRAAYGGLPAGADRQLAVLPAVHLAQALPGDLVFLGPKRYGVQGVGIVLDARTMLTADARLAGVVVTDLPAVPARAVPQADDGGLAWRCGGVELPPRGPGEAPGAWGGYPNGFIPRAALCRIGVGQHLLRCDAAAAFTVLTGAYAAAFGREACVTDSYRTFAGQVGLYRSKPALAAVPGTSNHGWGMAVDLCGGAQSFATAEYAWLVANAPRLGWSNPHWARRGQGREEPWHWEFTG